MNELDFAQSVAVIRTYEKGLLTKQNLDRIIDSSSYEDAIKILQEVGYNCKNIADDDSVQYEVILKNNLKESYDNVRKICPYKDIIDFLSLKYDYHNIKVSLKGKYLKKDFSYIFSNLGKYDVKDLNSHIILEDLNYFDEDIKKSIENAEKSFNEFKDPQGLEIELDKGLYKALLNCAKHLKNDLSINITRYSIDFINFKTLLRLKRQGADIRLFENAIIDGGFLNNDTLKNMYIESIDSLSNHYSSFKHGNVFSQGLKSYLDSGNFSYFEKLSDDFIMQIIKPSKYSAFGMEPIISFLSAKENEIKALRIILVGKINNISKDSIRERLRDVYV